MRGRRQGRVVHKDGGGRGCAGKPVTSWKVSVCNIQASVQVVFGKIFPGFGEGLRVHRLE